MAVPSTINLVVQPSTITVGQSATITWSTGNATSCNASGAWSGSEPTAGNMLVTPTAAGSDTYTMTCTGMSSSYGGGASSTKSVTVTVNAATAFAAKNLVADTASGTVTLDTNLVNPWGIAFGPGAVWVANNHSETSTLYDGTGAPQPVGGPLIVNLPAGAGGATFDPTGIVFNPTADFVVSAGGKSAAALFIYVGEGGMLAGWSKDVDVGNAVVMYTDSGGAVYKGLTLANNGAGNFLYVADFHNNKVDVFNATFTKQPSSATSFTFKDSALPAGYAPFGIQALKTGAGGTVQIYVAYAKQQGPDNHDNANGAGLGLIDIYDANGTLVKTLVMPGGALNAPWGMALAPADFGTLSNVLLVGNFGDGKINGYDPNKGQFMGTLSTANGAFAASGLWGIAFGNDAANQPHNTLFFAAGPNDEVNGSYGRIDLP
ncbi:MAG: TIGR03118 family protein [Candidatus Acidiferrum sp.]